MRIALFTRCLPRHGLGGMEIHSEQVALGLAARGHEVTIFTTRLMGGPEEEGSPGLRILYLRRTRPRSYLGGYWKESRAAFEREHARAPFDAAYSESSGAFGLLDQATPPVPVVLFLIGTPLAELRSKLRQGITPRRLAGIAWNLIGQVQARRLIPRAARILCESEGLRRWATGELRLPADRTSVVGLGVDTTRFSPEGPIDPEIARFAPSAPRIVMGGRFEKEKGFAIALEGLAEVTGEGTGGWRPPPVFLVGDGRERDRLLQAAEPLRRAGRFHHLPPVPHDRLPGIYRAASIYIMPTIRQEGSALSIVEAMACGCAIVASRIGGMETVLHDGRDALLVPPGDAGAISRTVQRLCADPDLRSRLGAMARKSAVEGFGLNGMIDSIEQALLDAAREGRAAR